MINRDFLEHPFIKRIAGKPKWSFSVDKKLRDINVYMKSSIVKGAQGDLNDKNLTTLYQMIDFQNQWPNATYCISPDDHLICLDIEKTCSEDVRERLLKIPALYAETSLSGKGYHLWFDSEDLFDLYPQILYKPSMKVSAPVQDEHNAHKEKVQYEFLFNQLCTFTGNVIRQTDTLEDSYEALKEEFSKLAEALQQKQQQTSQLFEMDASGKPDIPYESQLIDYILNYNYIRKGGSSDKSQSAWDYGWINTAINRLMYCLTHVYKFNEVVTGISWNELKAHYPEKKQALIEYTPEQITWLVYLAGMDPKSPITIRENHLHHVQGMPHFMYQCKKAMSMNSNTQDLIAKYNQKTGFGSFQEHES